MSGNFYEDVDQLAESLIDGGQEELGEEIRLAVETGSTGSEIMMRLRKVFQGALENAPLGDDDRARMTTLLDGVNRVL